MLDTPLASGLHDRHPVGHKTLRFGGVAQLVRALACHARGRGFKSRHSRHFSPIISTALPLHQHGSLIPALPATIGYNLRIALL